MNYRLNTTAIAVIVLFTVAAIALFLYILLNTPHDVRPSAEVQQDSDTLVSTLARDDVLITAKQQYVNGTHTIAGSVTVPTPCHGVSAEPFLDNDGTSTVAEIRLSTVLEGENCPNVSSDTSFRVIFDAPEDIVIRAVWDGSPVRLNLLPLGPDESFDEEFFFKG